MSTQRIVSRYADGFGMWHVVFAVSGESDTLASNLINDALTIARAQIKRCLGDERGNGYRLKLAYAIKKTPLGFMIEVSEQ